MADPFESLQQPGTVPHSALRESFIQQAVTFLNDPRVRGADPNAALDFLRKKGITEDELREAYRRSGVPFPSQLASSFPAQANTPLAAQYFHTTAQLTPFQQAGPARGASWLSVFFGITAAAGIYAALREVLKRYVVPLYFPEAARVAEERRRRDEVSWQVQETQIAELRERVRELVESWRKTNEKVEQLTTSITSSMVVRERELSQGSELRSELRNAIRQLSYSVSASGGTQRSRTAREDGVESKSDGGYLRYVNGAGQKRGSLAYSHTDEFNGIGGVGDVSSMNTGKEERKGEGDEDEFMGLKPAEVEVSWGLGMLDGGQVGGGESVKEVGEIVGEGKDGGMMEKERGGEVERGSIVASGIDDTTKEIEINGGVSEAARRLFERDLMNEARLAFGVGGGVDGGSSQMEEKQGRGRPLSLPTMDAALSDDD